MKKLLTFLTMGAVVTFVLFFCGTPIYCAIPHMINYQGMLTDDLGDPLSGPHNLTFRIYDDTTGGDLEWSETQNGVQVEQGLFNVILGQVTLLDLPFDEQYWLEVQVDSDTMPRLRFTSVGYAYRARVADSAVVAGSGAAGGWVDDGTAVRLQTSTDKVGIGTTSPGVKLHITGGTDVKEGTQNSGYLILGSSTGAHIAIDNNEIMAKASGTSVGDLYIQASTEANTIIYGKVGIGTSTPNDDLHVANHIRVGEDPAYPTVYGSLIHDGGGTGFKINAHAGGGGWADMYLQTNATTKVFIESGGNVGVGTTSPNSRLHVNGSVATSYEYVNVTFSPYYLSNSDFLIKANAGGGDVDIHLPGAAGVTGRIYIIKRVDDSGNLVSLWPAGSDKIDGASYYRLHNKWGYMTVFSDGFDWLIIGKSW